MQAAVCRFTGIGHSVKRSGAWHVTGIAIATALFWNAMGETAVATGLEGSFSAELPQPATIWHLDSLHGLELRGINEDGADPVRIHASVSDYRGRHALRIVNEEGQSAGPRGAEILAIVRSSNLLDGTIELNVAGFPRMGAKAGTRGFVGVAFRVQDGGRQYETFYLRMTNGRAEDQVRRNHTVQYSALPDFPWNRLRDENPGMYESYVDLAAGAWTRIKIEIAGATASFYVNGAREPCLIVKDLKLAPALGNVALWVGSDTVAYFSDLTVIQGVDMS
ncbi:MAG: hypothetical protein ABSE43_11105 [Steroidobacteraceae bacterium]